MENNLSKQNIIKNFKEQFGDNDTNTNITDDITIITKLFETFGDCNVAYTSEELEVLKQYKTPQIVVDFYKEMDFANAIDLPCEAWLLPLEEMKDEISQRVPSALVIKFGLITIMTTGGGDAVCLDFNNLCDSEPAVLYVDHSIFSDKIICPPSKERIKLPLSKEVIDKYAVKICDTFTGFLQMIINDEIEDIEDFYDEIEF